MRSTQSSKRAPTAISAVSDVEWAAAVRRERVIRPLCEARRLSQAMVHAAAKELGLSPPRIYSLMRKFRAKPVASTLVRHKTGPTTGTRRLSAEVEAKIEEAINSTFMKREKPTIGGVKTELFRLCREAGLKEPSAKALRTRVSARSLRERVKAREGSAVAKQKFDLVKQAPQPSRPLEVIEIDHTKVDVINVDKVMRKSIGRIWLTLVMDVFTRTVLGLFLSLDAPSATSVALALTQAVLSKDNFLSQRGIKLTWPAYGLPKMIRVDNGSEFHSLAFERGCEQFGIEIDYRPPGKPRFGGHIERLLGTLMGRVHALPGTTFSNIFAKGDYNSEKNAVLDMDEFERYLILEILGPYHNDIHSVLGCTPLSAWIKSTHGQLIRIPQDKITFFYDFLPFKERAIRRDGIRLFNIHYQDGALAHLVDSGIGKLRIKYNPRDLSAVFVDVPDADYIRVPYADLRRPPITLWEHRAAIRRLRAEGKPTRNEDAIFWAVQEQHRILAGAQAKSKEARRVLARTNQALSPESPPEVDQTSPKSKSFRHVSSSGSASVPMPPDNENSDAEFW
jgi:putative transposase